jgi:hypothetical protein
VIAVLYMRSAGHRKVLREEAGELAFPGQGFLLTWITSLSPEFVQSPDVIVVSVNCDRDHPLGGVCERAKHPRQRGNPCPCIHNEISLRSMDVI